MKPATEDARRLLHEGVLALSYVESVGMRLDGLKLSHTIDKVAQRIRELESRLKSDEIWKRWKRRFRDKASLGSRYQLGQLLYGEMDYKPVSVTRLGNRASVDAEALSKIDLPFVGMYLQLEKLKKLLSTYLMGIQREVGSDGLLHPVFNLHLVRTFRSSSSSPNFQNIPIRDKRIGKLVRKCFIPRPGHALVEVDYSSLEVRVSTCYNRDKRLIEYVCDPTKDMHRDMAAECFLLSPDQVSKEIRFYTKNQFVFPEFYGSFYPLCAANLWEAMEQNDLRLADGSLLRDWLCDKGISRRGNCDPKLSPLPGTFEHHIRKVEDRFWSDRFCDYYKWKKQWWSKYKQRGWLPLKTGFVCQGVYRRNDVINYPIQGSAFHCLLWSLIRIVRWLKKSKMKTVVVGQIHDSIVADVHLSEMDDYIAKVREVMTKDVREHWPWIIVPLDVEFAIHKENWFEE
ncbi:MAG: DNA polymerase [Candidatus Methanospirareceae archaeon]